ncbi:MAG TPA: hypothetical protein VGF94_14505 [Kofleriaceae bacterium]|jgi:hypothetical protein
MPRATTVLATTTLVGAIASLWLYVENRSLRAELADKDTPAPAAPAPQQVAETAPTPMAPPPRHWIPPRQVPTMPAAMPSQQGRLDKRARRTQQMATMFGRADGETDDQYRARVSPIIKAALAIPRQRVVAMRKLAEEKANVTQAQSQQLDQMFQKTYNDVLAYGDKAIADGTLSPYERNIANWLEFGGGLGAMLQDTDSQIGRVLSEDQMRTMYDAGFEWGEYLGLEVPWEQLNPPPPPPR